MSVMILLLLIYLQMLLGNLGDRYGARNILALNLVMSALSMVRTMNIGSLQIFYLRLGHICSYVLFFIMIF